MLKDRELRVIKLDVDSSEIDPKILELFDTSNEKISRKNRPSFFMIAAGKVTKLKPDCLSDKFDSMFEKVLNKEIGKSLELLSLKDLAENLRNFNKALGDSTFVYCASENDDQEILSEAEKLLKSETSNQILIVKNSELAN